MDEKRRLESRISQLEEDLEEEHGNLEVWVEKARKNGVQVTYNTAVCLSHHKYCLTSRNRTCQENFWSKEGS